MVWRTRATPGRADHRRSLNQLDDHLLRRALGAASLAAAVDRTVSWRLDLRSPASARPCRRLLHVAVLVNNWNGQSSAASLASRRKLQARLLHHEVNTLSRHARQTSRSRVRHRKRLVVFFTTFTEAINETFAFAIWHSLSKLLHFYSVSGSSSLRICDLKLSSIMHLIQHSDREFYLSIILFPNILSNNKFASSLEQFLKVSSSITLIIFKTGLSQSHEPPCKILNISIKSPLTYVFPNSPTP